MKVVLKSLAMAAVLLTACNNQKGASNQGVTAIQEEIKDLEMLTESLDSTASDIENTADELESLLDDIDQ